MAPMAKHGLEQRDRLAWAAALIAACTMLEVWGSWLQIGAVSGFPKFGGMTTGWILPVSTEAYWSCALYAWLGGSAGKRSQSFAMWSGGAMFLLSLGGQELAHLIAAGHRLPSAWVVGFVTALPLASLALAAVLVHLRHADRAAAAAAADAARRAAQEAAELRAEASEMASLRAQVAGMEEEYAGELAALNDQLDSERQARADAQEQAARVPAAEAAKQAAEAAGEAARCALEAAESARTEAEGRAATAEARAARLDRKLAAAAGGKGTGGGRKAPASEVPGDFDAHAEALAIYLKDPGISGAEIARKTGMSERWGQDRKKEFMSRTAENSAAE